MQAIKYENKIKSCTIKRRKSCSIIGKTLFCQNFQNKILKIDDIATVLGNLGKKYDRNRGYQTIPSAGATYPGIICAVGENCVDKLEAGSTIIH